MDLIIWKIRFLLSILIEDDGQDLVEYAMTVAVLALGAVAGMDSVGNAVNIIFSRLSEILYVAMK